MPLSEYFGGKGAEVMSKMKSKYGEKKGKNVFYATSNKNKKGKRLHKLQSAALRTHR